MCALPVCLQQAVDVVMESMRPNEVHILGNFMDNHDMPRMAAHENTDDDMIL